jgi:hypothetical protein
MKVTRLDLHMFDGFYPKNPDLGQVIQSDVSDDNPDMGFIAHVQFAAADAVAASTTGVHAAVTDDGTQQTITTGITDPAIPRNITATAGGTAADIKAIQVVITGTNINDEVITETLPAFTENTAGSVTGSKAFKTVTQIVIPAHDGTGATTSIGWGDKLGLSYIRAHIPCIATYLDNTLEGTAATIAASATAIESNTIDLNSALDGTVVDTYLVV